MLSSLSAPETAFLLLALMQAVIASIWLVGGRVMADASGATAFWAAFAALSAFGFSLLLASTLTRDAPGVMWLRAASNIVAVLALLCLRHGVQCFVERPVTPVVHTAAIGATLVASWFGRHPEAAALRVGAVSGTLALLSIGLARDLYAHARDVLGWRWPVGLVLPVLLGFAGYGARSLQALFWPESVARQVDADQALNLAWVMVFTVLALTLHAMLMALVVARLVNRLQHLSSHDGLTGLMNRRALEEAMTLQIHRSRRNGQPFVVMMIDADHFKRVNDSFGHAVGDHALKHVTACLLGVLRGIDRLARVGGEEFMVLLPDTTLAAALPVAERLRRSVATQPLQRGEQRVALSVSIGVTEWCGPDQAPSHVIVRADAALYRAKQQGRNRIAVVDPADPAAASAADVWRAA